MFRWFTRASVSSSLLNFLAILVFCTVWVMISRYKRDGISGIPKSTKERVDDDQETPRYTLSNSKHDVFSSNKGLHTQDSEKETSTSTTEIYLRERLTRIKQNCGDICKTDGNFTVNGMFYVTTLKISTYRHFNVYLVISITTNNIDF